MYIINITIQLGTPKTYQKKCAFNLASKTMIISHLIYAQQKNIIFLKNNFKNL